MRSALLLLVCCTPLAPFGGRDAGTDAGRPGAGGGSAGGAAGGDVAAGGLAGGAALSGGSGGLSAGGGTAGGRLGGGSTAGGSSGGASGVDASVPDGGFRWSAIPLPSTVNEVTAIAGREGTLYAVDSSRLFRSVDGGAFVEITGLTGDTLLALDINADGTLVAVSGLEVLLCASNCSSSTSFSRLRSTNTYDRFRGVCHRGGSVFIVGDTDVSGRGLVLTIDAGTLERVVETPGLTYLRDCEKGADALMVLGDQGAARIEGTQVTLEPIPISGRAVTWWRFAFDSTLAEGVAVGNPVDSTMVSAKRVGTAWQPTVMSAPGAGLRDVVRTERGEYFAGGRETARGSLFLWDGTQWVVPPTHPPDPIDDLRIYDLLVLDGALYVAGSFTYNTDGVVFRGVR